MIPKFYQFVKKLLIMSLHYMIQTVLFYIPPEETLLLPQFEYTGYT